MSYDKLISDIFLKAMDSDSKTPIIEWEPRSNRFRLRVGVNLTNIKQGDGGWRSSLRFALSKGILRRDGDYLYLPPEIINNMEFKYTNGYVSSVILEVKRKRKLDVMVVTV